MGLFKERRKAESYVLVGVLEDEGRREVDSLSGRVVGWSMPGTARRIRRRAAVETCP